jgi:hypothetical protein
MNSVLELDNLSSTVEIKIKKATIYPNPTDGEMRIETEGNLQSYELYSVDDRFIESKRLSMYSSSMDFTRAAQGVYNLLLIFGDGTIQTERVVIY